MHATLMTATPAWGQAPTGAHFAGSARYWETRYRTGGHSGAGAYGQLAAFKAEVFNMLVRELNVGSAVEFGCGDGNQLALLDIKRYLGIDVSPTAIDLCRRKFQAQPGHRFLHTSQYGGETAELSLSLDVIYHLVEDAVYLAYMQRLFDAAEQYVLIYASNPAQDTTTRDAHVRHRAVSAWVTANRPDFEFFGLIPNRHPYSQDPVNGSFCDFLLYRRKTPAACNADAGERTPLATPSPQAHASVPGRATSTNALIYMCGHDCEMYVVQALQSLARQAHDSLHVLFVDDASADSTPRIV
ncbi:MAG: methyltransferase domain-containing protein [Rubrivivax sp.]